MYIFYQFEYHAVSTLTFVETGIGFGSGKLTRSGNLNAVPNTNPIPGCNVFIFSTVSSVTFDDIPLTIFKSSGQNNLNTIKFEHCDRAVLDNSLGL